MEEKMAAEAAQSNGEADASSGDEIRVTDRRRVHIDGVTNTEAGSEDQSPSLKPTYIEELEARTRAAELKVIDVQARFERLRADLRRETDETRQRLNRAADERAIIEKANFITALLPVIDNLRRAIEAAEGGGSIEALLDGLHGTINNFENALAGAGVEAIPATGAPFDPEIHEAVDIVDMNTEQDEQITAEYSRGYRMGERLLRPARVQVGRRSADRTDVTAPVSAHKTAEQQ